MPDTGVEAGLYLRVWEQVSRESRTVLDAAAKLGLNPWLDRARLFRDAGLAHHFSGTPGIEAIAVRGARFVSCEAAVTKESGRIVRAYVQCTPRCWTGRGTT